MDREGRGGGHIPSDVGEGDRGLPDHLTLGYCHREVLERNGEVREREEMWGDSLTMSDVGHHVWPVVVGGIGTMRRRIWPVRGPVRGA